MEVEDDHEFGQRVPPLAVYVKRLLDRYQDGQILKELLQNAEDANATELTLTLDLRQFGTNSLIDRRLEVCQGPALVVYNNTKFKPIDWQNIQKTECSEKRNEPGKIGRFGIGFNSVYHLTDFPWIVSGETIAVFDPRRTGIFKTGNKAGFKWNMSNRKDLGEILKLQDQFAPFSLSSFSPGYQKSYSGTMFRFPLRQNTPQAGEMIMSNALYSPEKIFSLFKVFEHEVDRLLLFLKNVLKVTVCVWYETQKPAKTLFSVIKKITFPLTLPSKLLKKGEYHYYKMNISVTDKVGKEITKQWAVVHHHPEESKSSELSMSAELLPCVGVACPLSVEHFDFQGLISCYLPLPDLKENQTGLPVHIHGCFCLTESRRSIHWPTVLVMGLYQTCMLPQSRDDIETLDFRQSEKISNWNMILATDHLTDAYQHLITNVVKETNGLKLVMKLCPNESKVITPLETLAKTIKNMIAQHMELFQSNSTGKFVTASTAVVLSESAKAEQWQHSIQALCKLANIHLVEMDSRVFEQLSNFSTVIDQKLVYSILSGSPTLLNNATVQQRLDLLNYIVTDNRITSLEGLPLLLMADGITFRQFHSKACSDPVYIASDEVQALLPGSNQFLHNDLYKNANFWRIIESGQTQLTNLIPEVIPQLLKMSNKRAEWKSEKYLENLWAYIYHNVAIHAVYLWEGLPLIPIRTKHSNGFDTAFLDKKKPVLSSKGVMQDDVKAWLVDIGLPLTASKQYVNFQLLHDGGYIHQNGLQAIWIVWKYNEQKIEHELQTASNTVLKWLRDQIIFQSGKIEGRLLDFIQCLPIFKPVSGTIRSGNLLSAKKARLMYLDNSCFGIDQLLEKVCFSKPFIQIDSDSSIFINIMRLRNASILDVILTIFEDIEKKIYKNYDVDQILDWIFYNFNELKAQRIPFGKLNLDLVHMRFKEIAKCDPIDERKYVGCCQVLTLTKMIPESICDSCIIPCKHGKLHYSNELFFECQFESTCKYVCSVANCLTGTCRDFLRIAGVHTSLDTGVMAEMVRKIWVKNKDIKLVGEEWDAFIEIMKELHNKTAREQRNYVFNLEMPLPDKNGILQHAEELPFDDVIAYGYQFEQGRNYLGPIALHFGAKTDSDLELEVFEDTEEGEEFGQEFGQEVDLVTRINQLIEQCHAESDLIQEFLQNADDAGATKVSFILDERIHSSSNMLSQKWKELQGPAVLVYNDSKFTKADILRIQQSGLGFKSNDPEKIGRYGAGFNCCYRYSDCPSFISGDDILCIFDPLRYYLTLGKRKQKGGRKFKLNRPGTRHDLRKKFPSTYKSYLIEGFNLKGGTMFRLPLRQPIDEDSYSGSVHPNSESLRQFIQNEFNTPENVLSMLADITDNVKKSMVFLRNVTQISAYHIDGQYRLSKLWEFRAETEHVRWLTKETFAHKTNHIEIEDPFNIPDSEAKSVYKLLIVDTNKSEKEEWLIAQRIGFQTKNHEVDFSKVKLLPIAGIAYNRDHMHQMYCLLPKPQQMSGLQVSINGHFALDSEGWNNLFKPVNGQMGVRQHWNHMLLYDVAVNAYLDLLEAQKLTILDRMPNMHEELQTFRGLLEQYWMFMPNISAAYLDNISQTWSERQAFVDQVFKHVANSARELIPTITKRKNGLSTIVWVTIVTDLKKTMFPDGKWFPESEMSEGNQDDHTMWRADMFLLLHELGLKVVPCPLFVMKGFITAQISVSVANPLEVADYLRGPWAENLTLPCPVSETQLQNDNRATELLKFLLEGFRHGLKLDGVPLLVTQDGLLRKFSEKNPVLIEKVEHVIHLFPTSSYKFPIHDLNQLLLDYQERRQRHLLKDPTLSTMQLNDLIRMVQVELASQYHRIEPIQTTSHCWIQIEFDEKWMKTFWSLVLKLSTKCGYREEFIKEFRKWPLIPAKFSCEAHALLFRVDKASQLVTKSLWKMVSPTIFLKGLPIVEHQYFTEEMEELMFCGYANKAQLINVIEFWQNDVKELEWPSSTEENSLIASAILGFFTKYVTPTRDNVKSLRNLKVFETVDGTFVAANDVTCYTMDENYDINSEQQIWSSNKYSKVLLLKKKPEFQMLYQQLGIMHETLGDMYENVILQEEIFTNMETREQIRFLEKLHGYSGRKDFHNSLEILKQMKFIRFDVGEIKKALYELCEETDLFKIMAKSGFLCNEDFLPLEFELAIEQNPDLLIFLRKLGLKSYPTINLLKNLLKIFHLWNWNRKAETMQLQLQN